jgi:O-antigen ligase
VPPATPAAALDQPPKGIPFLIFTIYTFILIGRPQDYVAALVPLRLALLFTGLSLLVTVVKMGPEVAAALRVPTARLYLFFYLVLCLGIPFSIYRRASFDFVILGYSANLIFFVLFLTHVRTIAAFRRIAWVLTVALLLFSGQGMLQGEFSHGRYVTGSQMFDPNDVAFVLVSLLPFAIGFLVGAARPLARLTALAALLLGSVLTLYTGSRGGLLGLSTMVLLFLFFRVPSVTRFRKALLIAFIIVVAFASKDRINIERYLTLGNLESDYNLSDEFGRRQVWERGFRLFLAYPLTGVGADTFGEAIGNMRALENLTPYWQTAHNSYIQVLTETGLFGALGFVGLIALSLVGLNRVRRDRAPWATELGLFAGALLVGFVAQLVTAFFLSQAYSVLLTLFFAAAASMRRIVEQPVRASA